MKPFKYFLFLFVIAVSIDSAEAKEFYISSSGDDSNDGSSPSTPVKSISQLNLLIVELRPGDVVLFERGCIFNGQLLMNAAGDNVSPIKFSAYGTGKNPVISGSIPVTNWSNYKEGIFKTRVTSEVKGFFFNEGRMTLARYPNSGYLRIGNPFAEPNKGFTDNYLKQPNGYWNGSNVKIRTENWAYEYSSIIDFQDGRISYRDPTYYPAKSGWGYYLDNNMNHLDTAGEWYFDKTNKDENLYFYIPDGINSGDMNIQCTVYDYGFFSERESNNIIIKDLEFRNQFTSGIYFAGTISDLKIENCTFKGQEQIGILIPGRSENNIIDNCRFYNINGKAVYLPATTNTTVSNNIFQSIGMMPGYG
ncbi:MAG: right-handed parallel beta-helix repeat-containing protein, partial [Bacteroidetes bacterium]|nr:right-handed parallel beta-helix repeat-containing protein [Bacteroidota bacterium]